MVFQDLSTELQTVILNSHSYITKWLVFLTIIFLSSYYLFVVWKTHKPTKYVFTAITRMGFFSLSLVYLLASPLIVLLMSPEYSFYDFYNLPLIFYSIATVIGLLLFFVDMIRYGFFVLLKLAGLDIGDDNVNEIARQIENNKHFLKMKKRKR